MNPVGFAIGVENDGMAYDKQKWNSLRVNSECSSVQPTGPMPRVRQRNIDGHISSGPSAHAGMHR